MLYESFYYFLTFLLMRWLYYNTDWPWFRGRMWGLLFICIFGTRIFVELFKENQVAFEQTMTLNMGQLLMLLRFHFPGIQAIGFNKVQGHPFQVNEIANKIKELL